MKRNETLAQTLDFVSRYLTIGLLIAVLALIAGLVERDAPLALAGGFGAIALVALIWWLERPIRSLEGQTNETTATDIKPGLWRYSMLLIAAVAVLAIVESRTEPSGAVWDGLRIAVSVLAILAIGSALLAARRTRATTKT